MTKRIQVI